MIIGRHFNLGACQRTFKARICENVLNGEVSGTCKAITQNLGSQLERQYKNYLKDLGIKKFALNPSDLRDLSKIKKPKEYYKKLCDKAQLALVA